MERYQELAGADTGKASNDIKEIIPAAITNGLILCL